MANLKKALNPKAPEYRPTNNQNPSVIFRPPPPAPLTVAPRPAYFLEAPTVVYYQQHLVPLSKQLLMYNSAHLPTADERVGLLTSSSPSPTSPLSESPHQHKFQPTRKHNHVKPPGGRVSRSRLKLKWVKRKLPETSVVTAPATEEQTDDAVPIASYPFGNCTSLMIRNIPVRLSRSELIEMLDAHCRSQNHILPPSQFDFLYLPIDFKRKGNLGYAFVNFTNWEGASRLYNSWRGTTWKMCSYNTSKVCQICPAKFQGSELKKHFERSVFECESEEYLPIELSPPRDGLNVELTCITAIGRWVCRLKPHNLLH